MKTWFALLMGALCFAEPIPESLRGSLTLHAGFDRGLTATVARGDGQLYNAPDYKRQAEAKPGIGELDIQIDKGAGIGGSDALRFRSKNTRALFFKGDRHIAPKSGTISFWLRLDPDKDLAPGFCDPIQLTGKAYNDSAIWVDFTKDEKPRHFRLGAFGSLKAWNPADTPPDKNPAFLQRLVVIEWPSFSRERWTHIAIVWSGLDASGGTVALSIDGKRVPPAKKIIEAFDWNSLDLAIRLGVNYVGLLDEVAAFDRALTDAEIRALFEAASTR